MLISDSYSEKTSSSLPILVSFNSNLNTKKIKRIRDFLKHQPNCQKYVKRGPTFVADGVDEFRLYYVDSSLYSDDVTLKRLNVEKEEILFRSTSVDSLEKSVRNKTNIFYAQTNVCRPESHIKKVDKAVLCKESHVDLKKEEIKKKVSKSFQIGSNLQFNVVYVNADIQCNSFKLKTVDACAQTVDNHFAEALHDCHEQSSQKLQTDTIKTEIQKKAFGTFKDFYSRFEEKKVLRKFTDDSIEPAKTSVKFSIKKSPPFVANYILEILNTTRSSKDMLASEVHEKSFMNRLKFDDLIRHVRNNIYGRGNKYNIANCTNRLWYDSFRVHNAAINEKHSREHHKHLSSEERRKNRCRYHRKYTRGHKYRKAFDKTRNTNVECLYQCTDMDFFVETSHYAILKKYHKRIKEAKEKRDIRRYIREKYLQSQANKHEDVGATNDKNIQGRLFMNHYRKTPQFRRLFGDSGTRTTITEFLQSFNPWHWQNNSKLSVCVDDEYLTEDFFEDDTNKYMGAPTCRCGRSKFRKYFAL